MILHRFCSRREFDTYMRGETLISHCDHYQGGRGGSISIGFCFFKGNIQDWARRLNGLVDFDVLLTVDADLMAVRRSTGVYADWSKDDGHSTPPKALFEEWCTPAYNRASFRFISADRSFAESHISRSEILRLLADGRSSVNAMANSLYPNRQTK